MQLPTNIALINFRDLPEDIFRQKIVEAIGVQVKLSTSNNTVVSIGTVVKELVPLVSVAQNTKWVDIFNKTPSSVSLTTLSYTVDTVSASYVQSEVQNLSNKIQAISVKVDTIVSDINKALILN